jgi:hypothetical protein
MRKITTVVGIVLKAKNLAMNSTKSMAAGVLENQVRLV